MPNVGINGFCRTGRIVLRTCLERPELQVTAINDPAIDIEYMCYLIKFDSTHGKWLDGDIIARRHHSEIKIKDITIKIFHEKTPGKIPWQLANVQYVIEASGMFTSLEKASGHLANGVQQVIVTAPSVNIPMLILGVNEQKINSNHRVISTTSSTLYCLAPVIKILEENFGVSEGFITSIHAMTPSLKPLDGLCLRGKYWRDHRSIHQNIIPASTGACKALGKIIPSVKDKLAGTAFRVPIVNVSILDITIRLNTPTSITDILLAIEKESATKMKNIIRISNEDAVSSDFMNESYSCVVDADSSLQLRPNFFKLICWYENEYSYACRVVDSIWFTEKLANTKIELNSKLSVSKVPNRSPVFETPKQMHSSIVKRVASDISQESAEKKKTSTRIPKRVPDKSYVNVCTAEAKVEVTNTINEYDSTNLDLDSDPNNPNSVHLNCGTFLIAKNLKDQQKDEVDKVNTSIVSKKTFLKTISSVKIFQAQQERLDKVKKEFEKVASFTEDLLNKTKMVNKKLLSLSNESINVSKDSTKKPPDEAASTETYIKYGARIDSNIMRSSECSEEVKNWNFEEYKEGLHSRNSEDNQTTEDVDIRMADTVVITKNNEESDVINLNKEIKILNTDKVEEKENNHKTVSDDTLMAESCYNDDKRDIVDEKKCTAGHGQYFGTMNHVIIYERFHEAPEIKDTRQENLGKVLSNLPSASRVSGITADTFLSKMEMARDLSDLYDKLDSVSNSGSESSFPEKKSQVIKFSDLSHSMDELEKIDQFCKIIEISDEISDHLFTTLTNNGTAPKNEWSFGELCKKINLDDFCKKMFKKS